MAEGEPFADLLRLTGSAASWGAEMLAGVAVDAARMRANLDATGGLPLRDALLGVPEVRRRLDQAGVTAGQIDATLDPAGHLGVAGEFVDAALAAHRAGASTAAG